MNRLLHTISYVGAALIAAITVLTGVDIVARYLFNAPVLGTYELTNVTLAVIGALGIALSTAAEEHIAVDVVYERLRVPWQRALTRGAQVIAIVIFAVLTWQSAVSFVDSIFDAYETTDLLHVPVYPFRLGVLLAFLVSLVAVVRRIAGWPRWRPEDEDRREGIV